MEKVQEPLLFLFIDDIDLKMVRSRELMEAILQYANHSHVVTVLSGDYDILLESVSLALLQDENLQQSNITPRFKANNHEMIIERKQTLAHEYIKKIIPPARRHQLLQWNEQTIPMFAFDNRTLMDQLTRLFGSKNLFSYTLEGSSDFHPISKSYSIFDRTPRGIVNVYYHIHEMNERFAEFWRDLVELGEQEKKERFTIVKSLVDTILLSSTKLAAEQRDILENFIKWGQNSSNSYLDYSKVETIKNTEIVRKPFKKEVSDADTPKQEETLLLPLLIVGELIQSLLIDVRVDNETRRELQLKAFRGTLQLDTASGPQKNSYGMIVDQIFSFIGFQNALILADLLLDRKEWLVFPYGSQAGQITAWTERVDRWLLTQLNELVSRGKEEKLLTNLYYNQYVRAKQSGTGLNDAQFTLEFLTRTSNSVGKYIYFKSLYEYPPSSQLEKRITIPTINTDYALELFFNFIVEVHSWESAKFESELNTRLAEHELLGRIVEKRSAGAKLRSSLVAIKEKQQKTEEFTPAQKNRIDKLINQFYDELFNNLRSKIEEDEFRVGWKDRSAVVRAIEEFMNGRRDGVSETTFKRTKQKVERTSPVEMLEKYRIYSDRRYSLELLANNYYVWYGRQEASSLLQILKQQAYMAPLNLEPDELWVLRHLDIYLEQVQEAVQTDPAYEKIKEEMRIKLDKGFKEAMALVETDLNELGIELDDDEELNENAQ